MQGIVTGASRGLGLALTRELVSRGWQLVVDARDTEPLERAVAGLEGVVWLAGDVADPDHRRALVAAAGGPIDLLVNNASTLGPTPLPALAEYPLEELRHVYEVNVLAPLALVQLALPRFRRRCSRPERQLRRRGRALRAVGRVRLVEGRAVAADGDSRRREP